MWGKNAALFLILTLMIALLAAGCATITGSTSQRIPVTSFPAGARVIVNGVERGVTPLELMLSKNREHRIIRIESLGYHPMEIRLAKKTSGASLIGNFLLGVMPGVVPAVRYSLAHDGRGFYSIWIVTATALGLLFTVVDTASGAATSFEPKEIIVTLKKADGPPRIDTILIDPDELRNIKWIRVHRD